MSLQMQSVLGLLAFPLIAWAISERHGAIKPRRLARILIAGIGLQVLIAGVMLNVPAARSAFDWAAGLVSALQTATGRRHAPGIRLSRRRAGAVRNRAARDELHPGLPGAAADPPHQRAVQAALPLGHPAAGRARDRLGAAALARRHRPGRHVGSRQRVRRHGGGAAAGAALSRRHEPQRPVRHHDRRHGGRGGHRAGALRDCPGAGAAGRGGASHRLLRHHRARGADAGRADGAGRGAHRRIRRRSRPTSSSPTRRTRAWTPSRRARAKAWSCSST